MRLAPLKLCMLLIIFSSSPSNSTNKDISTEEYVREVYSAIQQTWPELKKVWDTTAYQNLRLIVGDGQTAWSIDSQNMQKIPYAEIQKRHLPVGYLNYQEIRWSDNRPTLYVSLGETLPLDEKLRLRSERNSVPDVFSLATHEAFHFFVQKNGWNNTTSENGTRATSYPVQTLPRIYRNSIIRSLYAAMQGKPDALGHARYWYDLWKKEYPDEVRLIRQTDVDEGSARYIEYTANVMARGKSFGSNEFRHAFAEMIKDKANTVDSESDSESYTIGALSGVIMDMNNTEWQSAVSHGAPPLEILLKNTLPVIQQVDKKLSEDVKTKANAINNKIGPKIDNFYRSFNNPDSIKIFLRDGPGSVSITDGFFITSESPYTLAVGLSTSARWSGGSYTIKDSTAMSVDKFIECGGESGYLFVHSGKDPEEKNDRLLLQTKNISIDIPYPDKSGISKVICLG